MSNETRAVDMVGIIFDQLTLGIEPDESLLQEAKQLNVDVEAIREKVSELYGDDDDYEELDFND